MMLIKKQKLLIGDLLKKMFVRNFKKRLFLFVKIKTSYFSYFVWS